MESRLIPAVVLVPALIWPACNGGTENLGKGEGGSAGAELTSTSTGKTQGNSDGDVTSAGGNSLGFTGSTTGSGGLGSGGTGDGSGGTEALPDSGPIGNSGPVGSVTGTNGNSGAGGWGSVTGANSGAGGNFGAGGGYGSVGSTTSGMGAGGGIGAGGGSFDGATRLHNSSQVIPMLAHDAAQLYTGGFNLAAVLLPDGPGTILDTADARSTVAVDDTQLYVCSPGSLY